MPISRPSCTITVNGGSYSGREIALGSLDIDMNLEGGHDLALINGSSLSPLRDAGIDEQCTIALGAEDEEVEVFTGVITAVRNELDKVSVEVMAATYPLSQTFTAQAYMEQTVADIINDLAGQAGVRTGAIDSSLPVAIWYVTEQRSAWWQIKRLAEMGDCEVLCDESGALVVRPVGSGGAGHTLRYGAELLRLDCSQLKERSAREFAPAGAGSELGSAKWHITLREPVGAAPAAPATILGALRDRDGAGQVTDGAALAAKRAALLGRAVIMGNSAIRPGDTVDLEDIPGRDGMSARVVGVKHIFDAERGFVTILRLGGVS